MLKDIRAISAKEAKRCDAAIGGECWVEQCQYCCDHSSSGLDHGICIDCGYEVDMGELIDEAELYFDPER